MSFVHRFVMFASGLIQKPMGFQPWEYHHKIFPIKGIFNHKSCMEIHVPGGQPAGPVPWLSDLHLHLATWNLNLCLYKMTQVGLLKNRWHRSVNSSNAKYLWEKAPGTFKAAQTYTAKCILFSLWTTILPLMINWNSLGHANHPVKRPWFSTVTTGNGFLHRTCTWALIQTMKALAASFPKGFHRGFKCEIRSIYQWQLWSWAKSLSER